MSFVFEASGTATGPCRWRDEAQRRYQLSAEELGLKNPLEDIMRSMARAEPVTRLPTCDAPAFLVHDPDLVHTVLGREHRIFVEGAHPYRSARTALSDEGRAALSLPPRAPLCDARADHLRTYAQRVTEEQFRPLVERGRVRERDVVPDYATVVLRIMARTLFDHELGERAEAFFRAASRQEDVLAIERRGTDAQRDALASASARSSVMRELESQMETMIQSRDVELVRASLRTFMNSYAGVATTLAWASYALAGAPAVQEELSRVLGSADAAMSTSPYVDAVLRETLRMYPAAWMLSRTAATSARLAGVAIPSGASVFVCTYSLHRDPRFWEEAEAFAPERFLGDKCGGAPPYAYIPYGAGTHRCAGVDIAIATMSLVLSTVLRLVRFLPAPDARVFPYPRVALRPEPGAIVRLRHR